MKYKWLPVFDVENCSSCRGCVSACHCGAIRMKDDEVMFNPDVCASSGRCVEECPIGGIHMAWVPYEGKSARGLIMA